MALDVADYWRMIHAERERLAEMLAGLSDHDWSVKTLCFEWSVEDVVAHLSAAASTGTVAWMRSMLLAKFKPNKHNQRQLARYLGDTPAGTMEIYRNSIDNITAPTKDYPAWLGEVIVHGQDIARPLSLRLEPNPIAVEEVTRFYAMKDFAVNSKSLVSGLTLEAIDSDFRFGSGPLVRGQLLDLVMTMAGRPIYLVELDGDGIAELNHRMEP